MRSKRGDLVNNVDSTNQHASAVEMIWVMDSITWVRCFHFHSAQHHPSFLAWVPKLQLKRETTTMCATLKQHWKSTDGFRKEVFTTLPYFAMFIWTSLMIIENLFWYSHYIQSVCLSPSVALASQTSFWQQYFFGFDCSNTPVMPSWQK